MPTKLKPAASYYGECTFDEHGLPAGGLFLPLRETALTFGVSASRVKQWPAESWWEPRFRCEEGFNLVAILFARWRHAEAGGKDPFESVHFDLPDNWQQEARFA